MHPLENSLSLISLAPPRRFSLCSSSIFISVAATSLPLIPFKVIRIVRKMFAPVCLHEFTASGEYKVIVFVAFISFQSFFTCFFLFDFISSVSVMLLSKDFLRNGVNNCCQYEKRRRFRARERHRAYLGPYLAPSFEQFSSLALVLSKLLSL